MRLTKTFITTLEEGNVMATCYFAQVIMGNIRFQFLIFRGKNLTTFFPYDIS